MTPLVKALLAGLDAAERALAPEPLPETICGECGETFIADGEALCWDCRLIDMHPGK